MILPFLSLHKSILKDLKYALVWGSSVKYQPQRVGKEHTLEDEDIVQIIKKHWYYLYQRKDGTLLAPPGSQNITGAGMNIWFTVREELEINP